MTILFEFWVQVFLFSKFMKSVDFFLLLFFAKLKIKDDVLYLGQFVANLITLDYYIWLWVTKDEPRRNAIKKLLGGFVSVYFKRMDVEISWRKKVHLDALLALEH